VGFYEPDECQKQSDMRHNNTKTTHNSKQSNALQGEGSIM